MPTNKNKGTTLQSSNPGKPNKTKRVSTDAEKLMKDHLSDENHKITDEDLRNLHVGPDLIQSAAETELPEGSNRPKDEDKDPKTVTPWDVLKES